MGVLEDLAVYLDAALPLTSGTDLFLNDMPSSPDALTVLYETPGEAPIETGGGDGRPVVQVPHVQVVTRAAPLFSEVSKQRARDVYNQLVLIANQTINGTYYLRVVPLQEPFMIRRDENERVEFAFNTAVHKGPE